MRLFVALDLDAGIRRRIAQYIAEVRSSAPDVRWVASESLHVTLKFIGEQPDTMVKQIEAAMASVNSPAITIGVRGAGFFPKANSARVFWVGIESDGMAQLAKSIDEALAGIGISAEDRAFSPHLTLARAGGGSGAPGWRRGDKPNRKFLPLQEKLEQSPAPDFGTMTAREFFLYRSQLSSRGSRYTKLSRFGLGPGDE
jgi:2'-5' RNA ligase